MTVVWFNGPSARDFYTIPPQSREIGCNFILEHRRVHHVCAYDAQVINRTDRFEDGVQYWTRPQLRRHPWLAPEATHQAQCSGTLALVLAHSLGSGPVWLVGCDWGITDHSLFDDRYVWRHGPPRKTNRYKIQLLQRLAREMEITMVHDRVRDLAPELRWQDPASFIRDRS